MKDIKTAWRILNDAEIYHDYLLTRLRMRNNQESDSVAELLGENWDSTQTASESVSFGFSIIGLICAYLLGVSILVLQSWALFNIAYFGVILSIIIITFGEDIGNMMALKNSLLILRRFDCKIFPF